MERYFQEGLASSTQKTYASAIRRYVEFCKSLNLDPVPASEFQLCRYSAFLAQDNLRHNSIKGYLAAVRQLHLAVGRPDPHIHEMARLAQVLRGIKRCQARAGAQPRPRLPISPELLVKLRQVWLGEGRSRDGLMLWAACSLCFFGFLRAGEITAPSDEAYEGDTHLSAADIAVDSTSNPSILKVHLKCSKTDPFRAGIDVYVGRSSGVLCPVTAVLEYMVARGSSPGQLFMFQDGRRLTRARFVERVRVALSVAGVDCSHYSGHSFRSGAATTAARCGIGDATIKLLGRWRSDAYQLYIKTPRQSLATVTQQLAKSIK